MATKQKSVPSLFAFLKEGLLLPNRNRGLFAAVTALIVASNWVLFVTNDVAIQPLSDEIQLDVKALNGTDPRTPDYAKLLKEIRDDTHKLMLLAPAYLLFAVVAVGSATRIVALFAAVATYSGEEQHTFGSLLGRAKAQLKGPLLTLAFVYVLEMAYAALLVLAFVVDVFLMLKGHKALFLVGSLIAFAGAVVFIYFSVVCSFSVVVAVAEPGCHGPGALGRAWRLVKERRRRRQVLLWVAVSGALAGVFSPVHTLARRCAIDSMAAGLLLEFAYVLLMAVVQVFATCAVTALYYECKDSSQQLTSAEYTSVPTQEANA